MAVQSVSAKKGSGVEVPAAEVFRGVERLLAEARERRQRSAVRRLQAVLDYIERVDNEISQVAIMAGAARRLPICEADRVLGQVEDIIIGRISLPRPIPWRGTNVPPKRG